MNQEERTTLLEMLQSPNDSLSDNEATLLCAVIDTAHSFSSHDLSDEKQQSMIALAIDKGFDAPLADDLKDLFPDVDLENPVVRTKPVLLVGGDEHAFVDRIVESARRVGAPELSPLDAETMIGVALAGSSLEESSVSSDDQSATFVRKHPAQSGAKEQKPSWSKRVFPGLALAAAVALGILGARSLLTKDTVATNNTPMVETRATTFATANLATGDRIHSTDDASYEFVSSTKAKRQIQLSRGTLLFDVMPLNVDESFLVRSEDIEVSVKGTVFSVENDSDGVSVRVYEGRVSVSKGSEQWDVEPGSMWTNGRVVSRTAHPLDSTGDAATVARPHSVRERYAALKLANPVEEPARAEDMDSKPEPTQTPQTKVARVEPSASAGSNTTHSTPVKVKRVPKQASAPSLSELQDLLTERKFSDVIRHSDAECRKGCKKEWHLLRAKALRGSQRFAEAADAYEKAAQQGAVEGWYQSARIRFTNLKDDSGAIAALAHIQGTSPLYERALALRVRALHRQSQALKAKAAAREYLRRYPNGGFANEVRPLVETPNRQAP